MASPGPNGGGGGGGGGHGQMHVTGEQPNAIFTGMRSVENGSP